MKCVFYLIMRMVQLIILIEQKISQNLDSLSEISKRLESVIIELEDINSEISYLQNSLEADPNELKRMTDRLDLINSLLHKHRLKFVDQLFDLKKI